MVCFTRIGVSSLADSRVCSTRLLTLLHVKRTILHMQLSPWGWTGEVRNT